MRRWAIQVLAVMLAAVGCGDTTTATTGEPSTPSTTTASGPLSTTATTTSEIPTASSTTTTSSTLASVTTTTSTSTTTTTAPPPDVDPSMLGLQPTGLGVVSFGDPETDVYAVFKALFGSPPVDVSAVAEWVEYVGWQEVGLYLGISQPAFSEYDGVGRLVGWAYAGGPSGWDLRTLSDIGIGTTKEELENLLGDVLVPPEEPDECGDGWGVRLLGIDEDILAHLDEAGNVRALSAGLGVGC